MSIKPFVFIGVGGTGGRTLGVIRQTLSDALARVGWADSWPRGWQFVHIDVPANPDGVAPALPYSVPRTDYVSLTDQRSTYRNFDQAVSQSLHRAVPDEFQRYLAWDCWRPTPPSAVRVNIVNGAGQYRAIGRVCAAQNLAKIDSAIAGAFDQATNAEAASQLLRIQQLRGDSEIDLTDGRPVIFVVGSVAGGSGSGMFLDVCDVLRAQGHAEINAIVFTPEVFEKTGGDLEPGIAPNTFAALNELANSMWTTSPADAPVSRDRLFSRAGVGYPVGHGGPSTVFLVGRRNGSVTFTNAWDVYKIVGRSLAELALNEGLTQDVVAYDIANSQAAAAGGLDLLELSSPRTVRDLAPFRSMGFSRITVGRDFFERYAADRMARAATLRLLDAHLLRRNPGGTASDEELLESLVDEAWPAFLRDSRLDEFEANNAITEVLNNENDSRVLAAWGALREKTASAIGASADKGKVRAGEARRAAAVEIEQERKANDNILGRGLVAVGDLAKEFQVSIQSTLMTLLSESIAANGLPATSKLVARLIARSAEASKSLVRDVDSFRRKEREYTTALGTIPAGSPAEFAIGATDQVEAIIREVQKVTLMSLRAQYHEEAKRLLDDVIRNLLEPWLRAIDDADGRLRREARPQNQTSVLDVWPGESDVPDYLRPSKVEFLLDEIDKFPQAFQAIVEQSVSGAEAKAAIEKATGEVIAGKNLGLTAVSEPMAGYAMKWSPKWDAARTTGLGAATAQPVLRLSMDHLRSRVHDWIWDDQKAIGRYVRQSMANYLSDPLVAGYERDDRKKRLIGQFAAMVKSSLPLVALDPTMAQLIHGHASPPYTLHLSPLNVPSEYRQQLEEVSYALLQRPQVVPVTTEPKPDALMMTLLAEPYHMVEFASIMDPITDQWSRLAGTRDFWQWRRARPLSEWVPLSPDALRDLVRGWFMARLIGLGYANPSNATELWLEHKGQKLPLARFGVRQATRHDHVGMVVEGVAMAMLEAYRSRSLAPLAPYRELIALGASCADEENELTRWVDAGGARAAKELQAADLADAETRQTAALDLVARWERSYQKDWEKIGDAEVAQRHPSYEINEEILSALADIRTCLNLDDPYREPR